MILRRRAEETRKGQSTVEMALVLPLSVLLIIGMIDIARLLFIQMNVEAAVQDAGRFASTGNVLPNPNNPGQSLSRVQSIVSVLQQNASALNIPSTTVQISSLSGGVWTPGSAGGPGDTVLISVNANLNPLTPMIAQFFPGGVYSFTASTTFKNEPFPPAS
jgi:Flp pilus assembly protein TadG